MIAALPAWFHQPIERSNATFFAHYMLFISIVCTLALALFYWGYHIYFHPALIWGWLPLQVSATLWFYVRRTQNRALTQGRLLLWFLFSLALLTGFLYVTGGAINPLIHLMIAPIAMGLVMFSARPAFILVLVTALLYLGLNYFYTPILSLRLASLQAFFEWHLSGSALVFLGVATLSMMIVFPLKHQLQSQQNALRKIEQQALQQEYLMALATFAASSAHRLGTPLNTLGFIETTLRQTPAAEHWSNELDIMADQLAVCQKALKGIRSKADQLHGHTPEPLTLQAFLNQLHDEFVLMHPSTPLAMTCNTPTFKLLAHADLSLAILNLLENAARYSPHGVELECKMQTEALFFYVHDEGKGLPAEHLKQFGKAPLDQSDGEGIGVYLTRTIVTRYGGEVSFHNTETGGCAVIRLPKNALDASSGKTMP